MSQQEVNRAMYDVLKCLVHSTDNYERGVVDLNAVALLQKLGVEIHSYTETAREKK
jgi:hypothetical protein